MSLGLYYISYSDGVRDAGKIGLGYIVIHNKQFHTNKMYSITTVILTGSLFISRIDSVFEYFNVYHPHSVDSMNIMTVPYRTLNKRRLDITTV